MSIDQEILQEFLVEAGELFDLLNDQFTELDKSHDDEDLINAIFRAFHTIKGGAGFMKLDPMVEVCHRAEDVINELRQKERDVSADMIDIMFQVLDELDGMFETVRDGAELEPASPEVLQRLDVLLANNKEQKAVSEPDAKAVEVQPEAELSQSEMDDEFEAMLNQANKKEPESDLISDDEFEAALDKIHGKGKHNVAEIKETATASLSSTSDVITDDEFESLLDNMHGVGKGPTTSDISESSSNEEGTELKQAPKLVADKTENKAPPAKSKSKENNKPVVDATVRVDTSILDEIMNLVGELVLVRNRLTTLKLTINDNQVHDAISTLELVTTELQSSVMKTRMQPIKKVFSRFPRVIRELARKLDKDIDLELIGEETDLDKSLVEALADPLIHLVRNAADHGIESPQKRFESGKPRQGKVTLCAKQEGDQILLTVTDDGKGLNHEELRAKAVEKGIMSESAANNLTNKEAFNLIFAAGFSTKSEISDVSGRGVGMDVVKTRINELSGNVEIDSVKGQGSVISIYLPLTLAILPTLMIKLDEYQFALPLSNVLEAFNMEPKHINVIDGQQVIRVRDKPLPLFFLSKWLVNDTNFEGAQSSQKVIVTQMGNQRFCLVVDKISGQEEVVIKPLGTMLHKAQGFSGATITGDGSIALIIDVPSLIVNYAANSGVY